MKKEEKIKCSYCGSSSFQKRKEEQFEFEPYGDKELFQEEIWICEKCGEELNYTLNFTDEYEKAQKRSELSSIKNILDFFNKKNIKFKDIEDSLGLPVRTLSRWKSRLNYSAIGLTLLRIIRSYPWIIYLAARRFEKKYADAVFKEAAMEKAVLNEGKSALDTAHPLGNDRGAADGLTISVFGAIHETHLASRGAA